MLQWALLVLLLVQGPLNGAARYEAPLLYNQKRVRLPRVEKKGCPTTNNARWEPIVNIPRTNRVSEISTNRRACGFYVWNAASASMYHLCRYLMKDYVYEGRGGRKVRKVSYMLTCFDLCHFTHSLLLSLFALSLALFSSFSIPVVDTVLTSASFVVVLFQIT
jgi:hypothetical protein